MKGFSQHRLEQILFFFCHGHHSAADALHNALRSDLRSIAAGSHYLHDLLAHTFLSEIDYLGLQELMVISHPRKHCLVIFPFRGIHTVGLSKPLLDHVSSFQWCWAYDATSYSRSFDDFLSQIEFGKFPSKTPVKEGSRRLPVDLLSDDANCFHSNGRVMELTELDGNLFVNRKKSTLSALDRFLDSSKICWTSFRKLFAETNQCSIQSVHSLQQILGSVFHASQTIRFENSTSRSSGRGIHFHNGRIDGSVEHNPRSSTNFRERRNKHENGLLVCNKSVDNQRSIFQHFVKHVTLASAKSTPVGEDNQRQILCSEIVDSLSGFIRTIWEPYATSFLNNRLGSLDISRISRLDIFGRSVLRNDYTHRNTSKTCSSYNHTLRPTGKSFLETALVEETTLPHSAIIFNSSKKCTRIIRDTRNWTKRNRSFNLVNASNVLNWKQPSSRRRNV
mmetsp:Transcript_11034/g.27967  ORF Transcript_11034/g.27967 Transcript_11034/m.27967 type:complete len:449 (+) Transcript_11034:111-1457(+)